MRLVIVSNRLPVSVKRTNGKLEFYPSVGGLATGLASYAESKNNKWVGWPGIANDDLTEKEREQIANELRKHNCYPVFLTHIWSPSLLSAITASQKAAFTCL